MYKQIIIAREDLNMSMANSQLKSVTALWHFSVGLLEIMLI